MKQLLMMLLLGVTLSGNVFAMTTQESQWLADEQQQHNEMQMKQMQTDLQDLQREQAAHERQEQGFA